MKIRFMTSVVSAVTLLLFAGFAQAAESKFQDGVHYTSIENVAARPAGTIEVVEAFSYMCTHCATFEPYIESWLKRLPESVKFVRYPVVFGRGTWELYARAYNTADVMGVADEAHAALMDKIWKQKEILKTMEELAEFYAAYGVKPAEFVATSQSFAVDAKMRREQRFLMDSGVNSTPNIVVNGKYLVAGNAAVANYDQLLAVVDYLIAEELATAGQATATAAAIETAVEANEVESAEVAEESAAAVVAEEN
ncbi:MAG: thiol:disulfide interchange protein DsbA/DsbL [Xanthomonadales bacterium]|nr:thiol:disulfide interchange protein DsbA/DsbL [Xanthomonadales bacterium]